MKTGAAPDWIEIWNSTNATINLSGYYLSNSAATPNQWALPAWTLGPNKYLLVFASGTLQQPVPAQAVAGQDNPGTVAQPHLKANFKLPKEGGYLALKKANGSGGYDTISEFNPYPAQSQNVSYGSTDAEGYVGYMETETPGQPNATVVEGFIGDTKFVDAADGVTQRKRGRYASAFNLAITCATPGATIRYTTNGSTPTRTNGAIYTGPIPINKTTVIRAFAYKHGWKASNVDTETYLFIDDVATQSASTATALGFPSGTTAPRGQAWRYGMTLANVTNGGGTLQSLKDALVAAPSVCMTTDIENLADPVTGINSNADKHGLFWERPASIEYINTAGTSEFQINCGVRIRGGASRAAANPRHGFHLFFRGSLYDGNLKYRLFGTNGASTFDQIDMRTEENYSWAKDSSSANTLLREEFSRVTQGDMGQPSSRNGYFHLYINGIYWGVFNWEERTEASYGETYLGGLKDNQDVVKSAASSNSYNTEMTDGNFAAWENLYRQAIALKNDTTTEASRTARYMQMRGLNADGTRNANYPVLLDVDNLIDYMLVAWYCGSYDAPMSTFLANASNNWFAVRDRAGSRGWAFFAHDFEHGMDAPGRPGDSYNRVGPWGGSGANNWNQTQYNSRETLTNTFYSKSNPQYLHEFLAYSAEYRQRFSDRVQKHLFNNGALTTAAALNRLNALAAQVDAVIHAEAARWGSTSLTRNTWVSAKQSVINYINNGGTPASGQTAWASPFTGGRTALLLEQLKGYTDNGAKPLYTVLGTAVFQGPVFSGQFGGAVTSPYSFSITNPNASGVIYYTVNGADPRTIGGGIDPTAQTGASPVSVTLNSTSTVRARVYDSATQTWSALTEAQYLVGALASANSLVISKIHYNPPGSGNLTQFVELMNIGAQTIDLSNVQFTLGIQFAFTSGYTLAPGARALIVRDLAAFQTAYPGVASGMIAGVFANGTSLDTGGERLQLLGFNNTVIKDFSYNNKDPWPTSPDGGGPCLVLIHPELNPDPSNGANWRASATDGGGPGATDATAYSAWASTNGIVDLTGTADSDGDGLSNLLEYAMGSNPNASSSGASPVIGTQTLNVNGVVSDYLTLTVQRAIGRDDAVLTAEASSDLKSAWSSAVLVGSPAYNGNGTETVTFRYPQPRTATAQQFLRLRVTRQP